MRFPHRRTYRHLRLAAPALLFLCTSITVHAAPLQLTDADGTLVTLPAPPQRIVVAGRASFMILHAAALYPSAADRLVAVSGGRRVNQEQIDRFTQAGHLSPNLKILPGEAGPEQLAPLQPDLVLIKRGAGRLRESLSRIGIPTLTMDLETPATFSNDILQLGLILNDPDRARQLLAYYQNIREAIARRLDDLPADARPRVLLIQASVRGGTRSYSVPGADWMQTQLVELAGGIPVWKSATHQNNWSIIGLEQIAAWNPDVVFVVDYAHPDHAARNLRNDPAWQLLRAIRQQRVYAVPADGVSWDQPDPRWILGLQWMARKLHPDRFHDRDPQTERTAFYAWYGLSRADIAAPVQGDWP
jgi:iron complex transport system substrate-binding protein